MAQIVNCFQCEKLTPKTEECEHCGADNVHFVRADQKVRKVQEQKPQPQPAQK